MKYLEDIRTYWNKRAEGYSKSNMESLLGDDKEKWVNILKKYINKEVGCTAIDMGCGPGFLAILLAEMGYKTTAFDYTENMLEKAKENSQEVGVSIDIVRGDAQNPQFRDNSFDILVSRNLIWNLEEPEKAYKEWIRILKPNGIMIVFDGNHYCYLFEKVYSDERNSVTHVNDHKHMMGVDTNYIDKIAEELPLSNKVRPQWDNEVLKSLGALIEETKINEVSFKDSMKEEKKIIKNFIIVARKPQ